VSNSWGARPRPARQRGRRRFDDLNRVLSETVVLADGTELTTSFTYNDAGLILSKTNGEGETTSYTYDASGNVLTTAC
jgi:YD repeat-containing protein